MQTLRHGGILELRRTARKQLALDAALDCIHSSFPNWVMPKSARGRSVISRIIMHSHNDPGCGKYLGTVMRSNDEHRRDRAEDQRYHRRNREESTNHRASV